MSIRQRVERLIFPGHYRAMAEMMDITERAWRQGPALMGERALLQALQEASSPAIDYVLRQREAGLEAFFGQRDFTESDRLRAVWKARRMTMTSIRAKQAVDMWTNFGFGQSVEIVPTDGGLKKVWDEFWTAPRNAPMLGQDVLGIHSNEVQQDGELYFVCFGAQVDGKTLVRRVDTTEITGRITAPGDPDTVLYFVRSAPGTTQTWYPNWSATPEQLKQVPVPRNAKLITDSVKTVVIDDKSVSVTSVKMLLVAFDLVRVIGLSGNTRERRGWPFFHRSYTWMEANEQFLRNRLAVAKRVAMFVDEIVHGGGSRVQDNITARFSSNPDAYGVDANPGPPAASNLIHNKGVSVNRRPLETSASDALGDGQMFTAHVGTGMGGVPLHWLGYPQTLRGRETSLQMRKPWDKQLERYQIMWVVAFQRMVEIVAANSGTVFEDTSADVTLAAPIDIVVEEIARIMNSITEAARGGTLDAETAQKANDALTRLALNTLGIRDVDGMLEKDTEETAASAVAAAVEEFGGDPVALAEFLHGLGDDVLEMGQ